MAKKKSVAKKLQDAIAEGIDTKVNPVKFAKKAAKGIGKTTVGLYDTAGGVLKMSKGVAHNAPPVQFLRRPLDMINPVSYVQEGIKNVKSFGEGVGKAVKGTIKAIGGLFTNHPEWYTGYPLDGLVNLNFGKRKSIDNNVMNILGIGGGYTNGMETSTVATVNYDLVIPVDENNSFAQAMNIMYSKIRAANSGAINYGVSDLAAYLLNVRSLRAAVTQLRRTLACCYYVSPYDADLPGALVAASSGQYLVGGGTPVYRGFNIDVLSSRAADIHNKLKLWYQTLDTLYPGSLPIFDRTDWLTSNVFADSNDAKANYYVFTLRSVPTYTVSGTTLTATYNAIDGPTGTPGTSFAANLDNTIFVIDNIFQAMATNINTIIAGDILKAFGSDAFYIQTEYPFGTAVPVIYDEAALTQIQNARINAVAYNGYPVQSFDLVSTSNTFTLNTDSTTYTLNEFSPLGHLINSYKDEISAGEVLSYTRFASASTMSGTLQTFIGTGTEICTNIGFFTSKATGLGNGAYYSINAFQVNVGTTPADMDNVAMFLNGWSIMDYAPLVLIPFANSGATKASVIWDFNNFAFATHAELSTMHQFATLSLFKVQSDIKKQTSFKFVR